MLLSALLFALTGAGAATLRFMSHSSRALTVNRISPTKLNFGDRRNSVATQQAPVTPQAIGALDPHVIAGGGGTSSGGSMTVTGTIGEVSAAQPMSGGSITVTGGFWPSTTAASAATPTPTPASSPTPTPTPTPTPPANVL